MFAGVSVNVLEAEHKFTIFRLGCELCINWTVRAEEENKKKITQEENYNSTK